MKTSRPATTPAGIAREKAGLTIEQLAAALRPGLTPIHATKWLATVKSYERNGYPVHRIMRNDFYLSKLLKCNPTDLLRCQQKPTVNDDANEDASPEENRKPSKRTRATRLHRAEHFPPCATKNPSLTVGSLWRQPDNDAI